MTLAHPSPRCVSRRAAFATAIPAGYRAGRHIAVHLTFATLACAGALAGLSDVRAAELVAVPSTFIAMNLLEYLSHRYLMHRRSRLLPYAFHAHVLRHHASFAAGHMAIASEREVGLILFGPPEVLLFILATLPGFALVVWTMSSNVALLAVAMVVLHYVLYETLHLVAHLPDEHWLARRRVFAAARARHARHHGAPHENFNVTPPLGDTLFRTRSRLGDER